MPELRENVKKIYTRYYSLGTLQAGELLLKPHLALELATELETLGVVTFGCGYWVFMLPDQFMEIPAGCDIPNEVLNSDDALHTSWQLVREHIEKYMPLLATHVSFINNVPAEWDLYPG